MVEPPGVRNRRKSWLERLISKFKRKKNTLILKGHGSIKKNLNFKKEEFLEAIEAIFNRFDKVTYLSATPSEICWNYEMTLEEFLQKRKKKKGSKVNPSKRWI